MKATWVKKCRPWVAGVIVGAALIGVGASMLLRTKPIAPHVLAQIGAALTAYANESRSGLYPPMTSGPQGFVPDLAALEPYLATQPQGDLARAYLNGQCGVQVYYWGYVIINQNMGLTFLEQCVHNTNQKASPDADISIEGSPVFCGYAGASEDYADTIWRLREGIERFFVNDIGNPAGSKVAQGKVPVLWEMPDTQRIPGGWVLYMDGHTEWLPYPSRFPMREGFIKKLRSEMPPLYDSGKSGFPQSSPPSRFVRPRPEGELLPDALRGCSPLYTLLITHCEPTPSTQSRSSKRYCIQAKRLDLRAYARESHATSYSSRMNFVLLPDDVPMTEYLRRTVLTDLENKADLYTSAGGKPKTIQTGAYLGTGSGYHWFAYAGIVDQELFRDENELIGGDDRVELLKVLFTYQDEFRRSNPSLYGEYPQTTLNLLPRFGARAVPFLKTVAETHNSAHIRVAALITLSEIGGPDAGKIIGTAFSTDNPLMLENAEAAFHEARSPELGAVTDRIILETAQRALVNSTEYARVARIVVPCSLPRGPRAMGWDSRETGRKILNGLPKEVVVAEINREIQEAHSNDNRNTYLTKVLAELLSDVENNRLEVQGGGGDSP